MLPLEAVKPFDLLVPVEVGFSHLGQGKVVVAMSLAREMYTKALELGRPR